MASVTKISQNEVNEIVIAIDSLTIEKAKELFFHLKVQLKTLNDIDINHTGNMRKINYVQAWYDGETDANWDKIVAGLKLVGMNSLAESLAKQKMSTSSGGPTSSLPSPPLPKEDELDLNNLSLEPAARPSTPPPPPPGSNRVAQVKANIESIEEQFFNIIADTQTEMSLKESVDPSFLKKVVDRLLALPVAQKAPHVKFFRDSEDDLLSANSIRKLIAILKRYCNWSNYEIMGVVVRKFCEAELQHRMQEYCESLETFERGTTVDIYLEAISAGPVLSSEFRKMVVALDKPANQCTLYKVRKLKETIAERASLQPYSVYIGDISVGSVKLELRFPASCVGWILGVMTPEFLASHKLSQVVLDQDMLVIVDRPVQALNDELIEHSLSGDVVGAASLLNSGAHVQTLNEDNRTPLIYASTNGHLDTIRLLISRGAQPDFKNKYEATALMYTAESEQRSDVVKELLSLGADPNCQDRGGDSAVSIAIIRNHKEILEELVKGRSDLNLQNSCGFTPLMIAVSWGKIELVSILLNGDGIDLDIQETSGGWTALHFSAENGDSATTHTLIKAGANVRIKAKNGWTALEIAEIKSADEDTQLFPTWNQYYTVSYRGERDFETVMDLLRGNIVSLPRHTLQDLKEELSDDKENKEETQSLKGEEEEVEREVFLKREWMRQRSQGRGREIMDKTRLPIEEPQDNKTSSSTADD